MIDPLRPARDSLLGDFNPMDLDLMLPFLDMDGGDGGNGGLGGGATGVGGDTCGLVGMGRDGRDGFQGLLGDDLGGMTGGCGMSPPLSDAMANFFDDVDDLGVGPTSMGLGGSLDHL